MCFLPKFCSWRCRTDRVINWVPSLECRLPFASVFRLEKSQNRPCQVKLPCVLACGTGPRRPALQALSFFIGFWRQEDVPLHTAISSVESGQLWTFITPQNWALLLAKLLFLKAYLDNIWPPFWLMSGFSPEAPALLPQLSKATSNHEILFIIYCETEQRHHSYRTSSEVKRITTPRPIFPRNASLFPRKCTGISDSVGKCTHGKNQIWKSQSWLHSFAHQPLISLPLLCLDSFFFF